MYNYSHSVDSSRVKGLNLLYTIRVNGCIRPVGGWPWATSCSRVCTRIIIRLEETDVPLFERVRRLIAVHDEAVVHECRHCGTTLESPSDTCDVCGSEDVARYVIE